MTNHWTVLFNVLCISVVTVSTDKSSDTLVFINNLQTRLKLPPNPSINLIVGNTGVGKSTYVHYVAGDNSKMISKRLGRKLKILDGLDPEMNKTTFATESRTLVPEMVIDESGTVWYDCPGFGDTHNETVEIATSFLIKKIVESASFVKIILATDYASVIEGNNRDAFDILLSRAAELIKDIKRYEKSVALVITKVPQNDDYGELLDSDVKSSASDFILAHRQYLQTSEKLKQKLSEKKVQLIDALLEKTSNDDYPRVSIFWRPSQPGSFVNISRMAEYRRKTRESILQHIAYAEIQKNDFGFPLTGEARLEVDNITKTTNENISNNLHSIISQILNRMQLQIVSAPDFDEKLYLIDLGKSCVDAQSNVINLMQLTKRLTQCIQTFGIDTIDMDAFNRIEEQDVNLAIFQSLIETDVSQTTIASKYDSFLKEIIDHLTEWERKTQEILTNEAQSTIANISAALSNIDKQIFILLKKRLQSIDNFENRFHWLHHIKTEINSVAGDFKLENRIKEFEVFIESLNKSSTNFELLNNLKRLKRDLSDMKSAASSVIIDPVYDWIKKSSSSTNYLTSQYNWYNFLVKTYNFFASYEVQRDVSIYNVANLSDWGKFHRPQDLIVDADNFNEFAEKMTTLNFKPTESNLRDLNEILNVTLKSPPQHEYNDDRSSVTIKGNFIRSSNILPFTSVTSLNRINVFVVHTFYVDCDLTLNPAGEVKLNILAHTWNIQQRSTFHLNGASGEYQKPPKSNGTAGRHGHSGVNAGDFFGFANNVIDGELLRVELNGGNGGDGQDGSGNEDYGHQFKTVAFREELFNDNKYPSENAREIVDQYFRRNGYKFQLIMEKVLSGQTSYLLFIPNGSDGRIFSKYKLNPRRCCGKTGRGGDGGVGGFQGSYTFLHANNRSMGLPKYSNANGVTGANGLTATICDTYTVHVTVNTDWRVRYWRYKFDFDIEKQYSTLYPGCSVEYAENFEFKQNPKSKSNILTFPLSVVEYKTFLLKKMESQPLIKTIYKTINAIDSKAEINQAFSPTEFALEVNALEKEYNHLKDRVDMLPMYCNLLKRMDKYCKTKAKHLSNVDRKLLAQIYSILLSKKISIENDHNGDLIVDIKNFFNVMVASIKKLSKNERIRVIREQRDQYKREINEKIDESFGYIKSEIEPELEKIVTALDDEMQRTLNETIELQTLRRIAIKRKEEKANEIRRNALIRKIFGIGKMIINIFSSGYELFKGLISDNNETIPTVLKTSQIIEQNYRRQVNLMDSELDELVTFVKGSAVNGNSYINKRLFDLHSKLKEVKSKRTYSKTSILLRECSEFVQSTLAHPTNDTSPDILKRLKKTSNFLVTIATNSQYISDDDDKVAEIANAINQDIKTLDDLMSLEDQIHTDLLPTINQMHTHFRNVGRNVVDESAVALDVTKWKMHDFLRTVQKRLSDAVSGRSTAYNINNSLVRLGDVMNLLIDIHDHIQSDRQQSRLISFLTDLQTINYANIDLRYRSEFIELEINLNKNLILSLYNRGIYAFKQAVFPYAADYLDVYQLPVDLALDSDINHYIAITTHKIESLSEKMQLFNATVINSNDMSIHIAQFNNGPGSRGPFYVWSNHEVRGQIEQLFSGKKIYLLADVSQSGRRNAVKFSMIDIEFWSANQTVNDQLNKILQNVHVSMTHMGESNYRCNNDFYTISSRPLTIQFSFSGQKYNPTDRNAAYDKLVTGFGLLSPYTLWAIQLKYGDFDKLKPYVDLVDIELHGFGQYVEEGAAICDQSLDKYYEVRNAS